ncbi:nucleotide-binding domain-containing protein [Dacryopinax primogenitus]|uniref:Nucleotide-binding domain-containing protein n=1 Tax=Dacryopinax primogenitus (strain DJM 731) TaxID=1858805 RepID=M5FW78_DACPD|nr:nucleotide-binding domain-containing protein [Dacryopinax primogenitus]EJT99929.1 nucleotide-binding domain-containing protein [Dacryopinax primogenitus]
MACGLDPALSSPRSTGIDVFHQPASLPHSTPSFSFWTARARHSDLIGHAQPFSHEADCVIISSGMSRCLAAYFMLLAQPDLPHGIVMLEAREAINAATACNGGHCRPDCYRGYLPYKKIVGAFQASKVIREPRVLLNCLREYPGHQKRDGHIDCDFWRGRSFDAMMTDECKVAYRNSYDEFENHVVRVYFVDLMPYPQATRLLRVEAAASFPAGSFYPYKFTAHLLRRAMSMGLNLQIHTPATAVASVDGFWMIDTPRGSIRTRKVLHATNGYASAILPEFTGKIVPFYGVCSSVTPTKSYSGKKMLAHTMSLYQQRGVRDRTPTEGLNSDCVHKNRIPADGTIIVGGGEFVNRQAHINNCDDSKVMPAITEHLRNVMKDNFDGWGDEAHGEGLERVWAGISGYTGDGLSYIGAFPGKEGQFVCAGFHGHGMARIATCARGVAMLMLGRAWEETELPECFQITKERLERKVRL